MSAEKRAQGTRSQKYPLIREAIRLQTPKRVELAMESVPILRRCQNSRTQGHRKRKLYTLWIVLTIFLRTSLNTKYIEIYCDVARMKITY